MLPNLFAILAVVCMFLDFYNPYLKLGTVLLCIAAAISFYAEYSFTEKKLPLFCAIVWVVNAGIHSFLFYNLIHAS